MNNNQNLLEHIVYVSTIASDLTESDLNDLVLKAEQNNAARHLTGILLKRSGYFVQFLEGPVNAMITTLENIKNDTRHRNVLTLSSGVSKDRVFPNWHMQSEESVIKVAIDRLISKNQEHTMPLNVIKSFLDAKS